MENLEQRIKNIEERNKKVETDKAWEWSITRLIQQLSMPFFKKFWIEFKN